MAVKGSVTRRLEVLLEYQRSAQHQTYTQSLESPVLLANVHAGAGPLVPFPVTFGCLLDALGGKGEMGSKRPQGKTAKQLNERRAADW